jgi:hypothetical protein
MCSLAHRFNMLLSREQYLILDGEADRSGIPIAELIRRAIDTVYMPDPVRNVREILHTVGRRPSRRLP